MKDGNRASARLDRHNPHGAAERGKAEAAAPEAPAAAAGAAGQLPRTGSSPRAAPQMAAAEESKPAPTRGKQAHRKRHRPRIYTVRRGDTLWEIAEAYYGGGWHYRAIVQRQSQQDSQSSTDLPEAEIPHSAALSSFSASWGSGRGCLRLRQVPRSTICMRGRGGA